MSKYFNRYKSSTTKDDDVFKLTGHVISPEENLAMDEIALPSFVIKLFAAVRTYVACCSYNLSDMRKLA